MSKAEKEIRIIIADDHSLFRSGLANILKTEEGIYVVGEARDGRDLIDQYFELKPDLIIVDINMPGLKGTGAVKRIKRIDPEAKALFLSMYEGEEYIYYTHKAGGLGLVSKDSLVGELLYAIDRVMQGDQYFGREFKTEDLKCIVQKFDEMQPRGLQASQTLLTNREKELLTLLAEGLTSMELAERLNISKRTIDSHRFNIMRKLELKSQPELLKYAFLFSHTSDNAD